MQPLPATGQETGIDLGIEAFATLSNGARIFSPGWYRKAERALKTAQRRVSRRKKGSNRRRKAVTLLAKAHQKVRRQRRDFHHKTALALVQQNDVIYHEDLQVRNMVQNHHLAKEHQRCGLGGVLDHPELQGSMRWSLSGRGHSCVHQPAVFRARLWGHCAEGLIRPLASLPRVWNEPTSGPQRGEKHRKARAEPSGRRGVGRVGEPRIRRAVAPAECQELFFGMSREEFEAQHLPTTSE